MERKRGECGKPARSPAWAGSQYLVVIPTLIKSRKLIHENKNGLQMEPVNYKTL
jgi:hypothetical protein